MCGCKKNIDNKEAIRQGVVDYLSGRSDLNIASMNVDVTSVSFRGSEAEATVAFTPKGAAPAQGMSMRYTLENKDNKWVVKNKADSGQNPHGAQPAPQGELPAGHPPIGGNPAR